MVYNCSTVELTVYPLGGDHGEIQTVLPGEACLWVDGQTAGVGQLAGPSGACLPGMAVSDTLPA